MTTEWRRQGVKKGGGILAGWSSLKNILCQCHKYYGAKSRADEKVYAKLYRTQGEQDDGENINRNEHV